MILINNLSTKLTDYRRDVNEAIARVLDSSNFILGSETKTLSRCLLTIFKLTTAVALRMEPMQLNLHYGLSGFNLAIKLRSSNNEPLVRLNVEGIEGGAAGIGGKVTQIGDLLGGIRL
jgi:phosphomannomutase